MINQSHGVGLLDGLHVQTLLPHHRLHLPLQGIQLPQPRHLGSPAGLFSKLIQFIEGGLVFEDG
uniref:Uncharacterized protein n=1 Tax=Arundo donax TaxID=35708 RepID=A0A0A9GCN1_ARUDO